MKRRFCVDLSLFSVLLDAFWGVFGPKRLAKQFIHLDFAIDKRFACLLLRIYTDVDSGFVLWFDWNGWASRAIVLCASLFVARNGSRRALKVEFCFSIVLKCNYVMVISSLSMVNFWRFEQKSVADNPSHKSIIGCIGMGKYVFYVLLWNVL